MGKNISLGSVPLGFISHSCEFAFRLMATHFFVNSNKEVSKKMPPHKFMPQALKDFLRSRSSVLLAIGGNEKNSRHKHTAQTAFRSDPPMPPVLGMN